MSASSLKRFTTGTALAAAGVLVAAGCGDGSSPAQSPVLDQIKLVNSTPAAAGQLDKAIWFMPKEPRSLDLDNDAANSQSDLILANVCERLLQLQPDLTLKPGLAEKYVWKDATTLVFTIRQGVTFHDGTPMTADDVLWSLDRHRADGAAESDEYVNVTGVSKTGVRAPLPGATVQVDSWAQSYTFITDKDGNYAYWLDIRNNPLTLIAAKDGYKPQTRSTELLSGEPITEDFALLATK